MSSTPEAAKMAEEEGMFKDNEAIYNIAPPTQEDVDYMENLLSQAKVYIGTDQKIISIV